MQLQFNGLPDEAVHIARLGRQKFWYLEIWFCGPNWCYVQPLLIYWVGPVLRRRGNTQKNFYHHYNTAKAWNLEKNVRFFIIKSSCIILSARYTRNCILCVCVGGGGGTQRQGVYSMYCVDGRPWSSADTVIMAAGNTSTQIEACPSLWIFHLIKIQGWSGKCNRYNNKQMVSLINSYVFRQKSTIIRSVYTVF